MNLSVEVASHILARIKSNFEQEKDDLTVSAINVALECMQEISYNKLKEYGIKIET